MVMMRGSFGCGLISVLGTTSCPSPVEDPASGDRAPRPEVVILRVAVPQVQYATWVVGADVEAIVGFAIASGWPGPLGE